MADFLSDLPRYVLLDKKQYFGPNALSGPDAARIRVIYGFSNKLQYDTFLRNVGSGLTPYPLVRGYLQKSMDTEPDWLHLVVLNASDCHQQVLCASTMQSLAQAMDSKSDHVCASHSLTLVGSSNSYRVTTRIPDRPVQVVDEREAL